MNSKFKYYSRTALIIEGFLRLSAVTPLVSPLVLYSHRYEALDFASKVCSQEFRFLTVFPYIRWNLLIYLAYIFLEIVTDFESFQDRLGLKNGFGYCNGIFIIISIKRDRRENFMKGNVMCEYMTTRVQPKKKSHLY